MMPHQTFSNLNEIGHNSLLDIIPTETNTNEVAKIRDAVKNGSSYCGRLLDYKKDGTPFWNLLTITPVKDDHGKAIIFTGLVHSSFDFL
ncbi:hypothetical protein Dsin_012419 [Dipteronia sinensis]|uniref:PAS domain-containing protein n=1 Tax=Dipteronia sinensis TaxID=43782 RepID=A0AAE0AJA9_9ROSI|nr:hypothetical protein Dsin_012419 [Dipteronia sinensis]